MLLMYSVRISFHLPTDNYIYIQLQLKTVQYNPYTNGRLIEKYNKLLFNQLSMNLRSLTINTTQPCFENEIIFNEKDSVLISFDFISFYKKYQNQETDKVATKSPLVRAIWFRFPDRSNRTQICNGRNNYLLPISLRWSCSRGCCKNDRCTVAYIIASPLL